MISRAVSNIGHLESKTRSHSLYMEKLDNILTLTRLLFWSKFPEFSQKGYLEGFYVMFESSGVKNWVKQFFMVDSNGYLLF
jgi:hypothetical protein